MTQVLPRHVGIIMDGNGRWAKQRSLPRTAGHAAGVKAALAIIDHCVQIGIETLTLFTFSTENWNRPETESNFIMDAAFKVGSSQIQKFHQQNIQIRFIGELAKLNPTLQKHIPEWEILTANNTGLKLVIAASYSGQWDIIQAIKKLLASPQDNHEITANDIQQHLSTHGLPDADLIIRTSGELRLSNFLLWQSAYAELYFPEVLWPDFSVAEFQRALDNFAKRQRRFGGITCPTDGN